ncbi:hypothetical protein CC1G_14489 [Coprinopsis cinerea okayama7|uniref:Uncharacterized protein n=1 Tax=Coprinopsis cinerea (strain Okayama-7 / 130 / ATCC MYA-4618 / FGSC 9003) TaxID=240176 RepID=D6RME4_COPC7|nr:hypothetical protein CC1G_14489 [Coprinopsis cinerea okayama7\|eukprot:XP_002911491.1 hypothetical protein CC1G_14489 [Coprinopsis cinerea okayama7\
MTLTSGRWWFSYDPTWPIGGLTGKFGNLLPTVGNSQFQSKGSFQGSTGSETRELL